MALQYNGVYMPPFSIPTTTTPTANQPGWLQVVNSILGIGTQILNSRNTQSTMYPTPTNTPSVGGSGGGGIDSTMLILIAIVILTIINLRK